MLAIALLVAIETRLPLGDIAFWAIVSGFLSAIFTMIEHASATMLLEWPFRIGPRVFTKVFGSLGPGHVLRRDRKVYGQLIYLRTLSTGSCLFIRSPHRLVWMPFDLKGTVEWRSDSSPAIIVGRLGLGAVLFCLSVLVLATVFTGLNLLNQGRSMLGVGLGIAGVAIVLALVGALGISWGRTRFTENVEEVEVLLAQ